MTGKIFLCVDRDGLTGGLQLSINLKRPDGGGHGYRISGPKFNGSSKKVLHHQITQRDADEICSYFKSLAQTDAPDNAGLVSGGGEVIAALYVAKNGSYINVPGVDPWPEDRDARLYRGPHPVVAHPPCQRWGKFWAGSPLHIKRTGERKIKGDDGGCFERALESVRVYGGVLEHPCDSHAWACFDLNRPPRAGGWVVADMLGGWTCCVEQGRYGHYARKPTWLYSFGCELPELDWGISETRLDPAIIARMGFKRAQRLGEVGGRGGGKDSAPRISTPIPFRELLLSVARTAAPAFAEAAE